MKRKLIRCPYCPCVFLTARDYAYHQQAHIMYPRRFAKMNKNHLGIPNIINHSTNEMFAKEEVVEDDKEWE